jgi:hypothetical protein
MALGKYNTHHRVIAAGCQTPDWTLRAAGRYFGLEVNDIEGDIFNIYAGVEWFPFDKLGFELGSTVFDIEVDSGDSKLKGTFEYEYKGQIHN